MLDLIGISQIGAPKASNDKLLCKVGIACGEGPLGPDDQLNNTHLARTPEKPRGGERPLDWCFRCLSDLQADRIWHEVILLWEEGHARIETWATVTKKFMILLSFPFLVRFRRQAWNSALLSRYCLVGGKGPLEPGSQHNTYPVRTPGLPRKTRDRYLSVPPTK